MHKKSFANEEIPDPKICRDGEILRIIDFRGKNTQPRILPRKKPSACFKLVLLVLNENKTSKPKRRGRAFETRGRVS